MSTVKQLGRILIIGSVISVLSSILLLQTVHVISYDDTTHVTQTTSEFLNNSTHSEEELKTGCPANKRRLEDFVVNDITQNLIPKTIHVLVPSKCVTKEYQENIYWWKLRGYSLVIHDEESVNSLLLKNRTQFPQLHTLVQCLLSSTFKIEIVKLLILWDYGGIIIDENTAPGHNVIQGDWIRDTDQAVFFFEGGFQQIFQTEFMAASSGHPSIYMLIQKTAADLFMQYTNSDYTPSHDERKNGYLDFITKYIFYNATGTDGVRTSYEAMNSYITLVNITHDLNLYFQNTTVLQPTPMLGGSNQRKGECMYWSTAKEKDAMQSLLTLVNASYVQCPQGQYFVEDIIHSGSFSHRSKIPKIIHFTSKTRCVTKAFSDNIKAWSFEGYSIFLHDDKAVARLLSQDWPEFPLLKDAVNCITSGGGFADIWRYLIIWEYGGVYTDIDNAPGPWLKNGSIIQSTYDAFFEIEAAKFPSQYFFASSPRHPAMYMAVQNTIQRLFTEQNIVRQYVPFVTGPGALKWAIHYTIGNAYISQGTYATFDPNRSITFVGNRTTAMRRNYVGRGIVLSLKDEYAAMNMSHYHYAGRQRYLPQKACLEVLHDMNVHGKYPNLLGLNRLSS